MKAYKGFTKDMKCRDFQYKEGGEYEQSGDIKCCANGFHACEAPLDCFFYYTPADSVYHEVELDGKIAKEEYGNDTKVAASKIKIGARINIADIVNAQIEFVKEKTIPSYKHHTTAKRKLNSATGDGSANSATGYGSVNVSTGCGCTNNAAGEANIAIGWGKDNNCKGTKGSFLVLSEWGNWDGEKYPFIGAKMVVVDGEKIKADTFYMLKDGKIVEVKE